MAESGSGEPRRTWALVFSGGVALGAYQAGAYTALHEAGLRPDWIAASSIGAVNAAIIAGNPPEHRADRLRRFWDAAAADPLVAVPLWSGLPARGPWRAAYNWVSALQARLFGSPSLFRPHLPPGVVWDDAPGQHDLAPLRERLAETVDFGRLNGGALRLSVVATDLVTGERVVFDTGRGTQLTPDHLLASCALLPVFCPVEVEGRLLGDGGLSTNAPLDLVLDEPAADDLVCFVLDLFAREGDRPRSLAAATERAVDLIFSSQSQRILEAGRREHRLRAMIAHLAARLPPELRRDSQIAAVLAEARAHAPTVLYLSYRAGADEAGPEKVFDFSRATLTERWEAGACDMQAALRILGTVPVDVSSDGLAVYHIQGQASAA